MAEITITIPEEIYDEVIEGLCEKFGYPYIKTSKAPEEFAYEGLVSFVKGSYVDYSVKKELDAVKMEVSDRAKLEAIDISLKKAAIINEPGGKL
jgi:hypothetical protein